MSSANQVAVVTGAPRLSGDIGRDPEDPCSNAGLHAAAQ